MPAFDYLSQATAKAPGPTPANTAAADQAQRAYEAAMQRLQQVTAQVNSQQYGFGDPNAGRAGMAQIQAATNEVSRLADAANAARAGGSADTSSADAQNARNAMFGMTAGVSDQIMNDPRVTAALDHIQGGMENGPYSDQVQAQLISRHADSSAHAEGVQAEQLRNSLAARGMGPGDPGYDSALRQMQSDRQTGNLAFAGDTQTNATLQNYQAQMSAAQALAGTRLGQYGQAQPGYGQAANYLAQTQYTAGRAPGTGSGSLAFSGSTAPASSAPTAPQSATQGPAIVGPPTVFSMPYSRNVAPTAPRPTQTQGAITNAVSANPAAAPRAFSFAPITRRPTGMPVAPATRAY